MRFITFELLFRLHAIGFYSNTILCSIPTPFACLEAVAIQSQYLRALISNSSNISLYTIMYTDPCRPNEVLYVALRFQMMVKKTVDSILCAFCVSIPFKQCFPRDR